MTDPTRIWLSPAEDGLDRYWHTEPAPGLDDDPADFVEYVRADLVEELRAQLQAALTVAGAGGFKDQSARIAELEADLDEAAMHLRKVVDQATRMRRALEYIAEGEHPDEAPENAQEALDGISR